MVPDPRSNIPLPAFCIHYVLAVKAYGLQPIGRVVIPKTPFDKFLTCVGVCRDILPRFECTTLDALLVEPFVSLNGLVHDIT